MAYSYKEVQLINPNLFSGSSDTLRDEIGNRWQYVSSSLAGESAHWDERTSLENDLEYSGVAEDGYYYSPPQIISAISKVATQPAYKVTGSSETYVPNFYMPVRLVGNPDIIDSDEMWNIYLNGGTWEDVDYLGIKPTDVYGDFYYKRNSPYSSLEENYIQTVAGKFDGVNIDITTGYNFYYRAYDTFINTLRTRAIPNIYMFAEDILTNIENTFIPPVVASYLTLDGSVDPRTIRRLMSPVATAELPPEESITLITQLSADTSVSIQRDLTYNLRNYLTGTLPSSPPSASILSQMDYQMRNILFGAASTKKLLSSESTIATAYKDYFPSYISITIPNELKEEEESTIFNDLIKLHNYDTTFLALLKNHNASSATSFVYSETAISASSTNMITNTQVYSTNRNRHNLIGLLLKGYGDASATLNDASIILDELDESTKIFYEPASPLRFGGTKKALDVLQGIIGVNSIIQPTTDPEEDGYFAFDSILELFDSGGIPKHSETLAYRIEKTYLGNPIQNIWIYNDNSQESFTYYDTQVKYNTDYEYSIYAYDVVVGLKYKYDDWLQSQSIASSSADPATYCMQFVDASGTTHESIFMRSDVSLLSMTTYTYELIDWKLRGGVDYDSLDPQLRSDGEYRTIFEILYEEIYTDSYGAPGGESEEDYLIWLQSAVDSGMGTSIWHPGTDEWFDVATETSKTSGSEFATDNQFISSDRYMAEFNVYYEPEVSIIETPLMSKSLRIVDNPPPSLEITPFQMIDDSQRIGFKAVIDVFNFKPLPTVLTPTETEYLSYYREAKDFVSLDEKVVNPNRSRSNFIEVYRTLQKPQSYYDFKDFIYKTYQLNDTSVNSYGTMVNCIDIVNTNTKYYYTFRVVTQLGIPGDFSEIYESELVDDGGYKYTIFNVLTQSDLDNQLKEHIPTSKNFKKLLYIKPNMTNLSLDASSADFTEEAYTQLDNIEVGNADYPIWDKKFKFRLTSKKTGKKIDFNITYRLRDG